MYLDVIHKLTKHTGWVKGVSWDPMGRFIATQSDDKSLIVWRTSDWTVEIEIRKPFEKSGSSTFFRRARYLPSHSILITDVVGHPMAGFSSLQTDTTILAQQRLSWREIHGKFIATLSVTNLPSFAP